MPESRKEGRKQVGMWLDETARQQLDALAHDLSMSKTEVVTEAIRRMSEAERLPQITEELRQLRERVAALEGKGS